MSNVKEYSQHYDLASMADLDRQVREPFVDIIIFSKGKGTSLGEVWPDFRKYIYSMTYEESDEKGLSETVTIRFADPDYTCMSLPYFDIGNKVGIVMGSRQINEPRGPLYVKDVKCEFPDSEPIYTIELADKSAFLAMQSSCNPYAAGDLEDVIIQIAKLTRLGLLYDSGVRRVLLETNEMQAGRSFYQLLTDLAARYGFIFRIRNSQIMFIALSEVGKYRLTKLDYRIGSATIFSFSIKIKKQTLLIKPKGETVDTDTKEKIKNTTTPPSDADITRFAYNVAGRQVETEIPPQSRNGGSTSPLPIPEGLKTEVDNVLNDIGITNNEADEQPKQPSNANIVVPPAVLQEQMRQTSLGTLQPCPFPQEKKQQDKAKTYDTWFNIEAEMQPTYPSMHYRTGDPILVRGLPKLLNRIDLSTTYLIHVVIQDYTQKGWETRLKILGSTKRDRVGPPITDHDKATGPSDALGKHLIDPNNSTGAHAFKYNQNGRSIEVVPLVPMRKVPGSGNVE